MTPNLHNYSKNQPERQHNIHYRNKPYQYSSTNIDNIEVIGKKKKEFINETVYIRDPHEENYNVLSKKIDLDPSINSNAKLILRVMLSNRDDFKICHREIQHRCNIGQTAFTTAMNQLIAAGYVKRLGRKNDKGRFQPYDYIISENKKFNPTDSFKPLRVVRNGASNMENQYIINTKEKQILKEPTYLNPSFEMVGSVGLSSKDYLATCETQDIQSKIEVIPMHQPEIKAKASNLPLNAKTHVKASEHTAKQENELKTEINPLIANLTMSLQDKQRLQAKLSEKKPIDNALLEKTISFVSRPDFKVKKSLYGSIDYYYSHPEHMVIKQEMEKPKKDLEPENRYFWREFLKKYPDFRKAFNVSQVHEYVEIGDNRILPEKYYFKDIPFINQIESLLRNTNFYHGTVKDFFETNKKIIFSGC